MSVSAALFASATDGWSTPQALFDELDAEFHFTLDVAASPTNAKCGRYFTRDNDGLAQPWSGTAWCNPPYGSEIGKWLAKAHEASRAGATVVCLLPARTDTAWWHKHVLGVAELRWLTGRLRFGDAKAGAPFPSVIAIYRPPERSAELPAVLTVEETAALLRISRASAYRAVRRGDLPGVLRIGGLVRVSRDAVLRWLEQGQAPATRRKRG